MTKNKSAISAEDVVAYITSHPECLAHHPDLLAQCLAVAKSVSDDTIHDQANIVDLSIVVLPAAFGPVIIIFLERLTSFLTGSVSI